MTVTVARAAPGFAQWPELLALLHAAFAYQHDRIDPPSSLLTFEAASLAAKAAAETLFLAHDGAQMVGCIFARPKGNALYVGKFAVAPGRQGQGIGAALMRAVERHAVERGIGALELDTRIELTDNHATFGAMGFVKIAESAHPGYDRPTFITMRKALVPSDSPAC